MVFNRRNLDWWCERGILLLVLITVMFAPLAFGAVYAWTFLVVQSLMLGIGLLWLARLWGGYKPKLLWPPLAWPIVMFVIYAVARYFTADIEYVARLEVIRVLVYAFLFFAVVSNLYDQESSELIAYALTVVAALASSYAIVQCLRHSTHVWNLTTPYVGRAPGTYINPDHFAGFLELVLPLPLALLLAGRVSMVTRILLAYAVVTILAGLAVTFSRGGYVAAAAGLLLLLGLLLCHRNHRLRAFLVLVVLLAGGGFFTAHYLSKNIAFMERVAGNEITGKAKFELDSRLDMWHAAEQIWQEHFWWGAGPGHFDHRFRQFRPESFQQRPDHAHNDYLELLADWGVAGGALVLAGIGVFIFSLIKTWPHVRRDENDLGSAMSSRYAFFLGGISGLFALAVHSLVDFNLHIPANALVGVVLLALVAGNLRFATKRYWWRARLPAQLAATGVLGVALIYFAAQGWRRANETLWTARAERLPAFSDEQIAALQQAQACEPNNFLTAYNLGESFRAQSLQGGTNYMAQAEMALKFYAQASRLNPFDANSPLRTGMCLDWLGKHAEAEPFFAAAEALDPNSNFVVANVGWHYVQIGDYSAARQWFLRACKLSNWRNDFALNYLLDVCEPRLSQRASGQLPFGFFNNGKGN